MARQRRKLEQVPESGHLGAAWTFLHGVERGLLALLLALPLIFQPSQLAAQDEEDMEYRVKLAFLFHFAQFIQWPPEVFRDPAAPLLVCVAGTNPFTREMEQELQGHMAGGHPLKIQSLKPGEDPRTCQIVFVRARETAAARAILAMAKGSSILTIGEAKGFAERGGIIDLMPEGHKLRFAVNVDAAAQTRLKISSKLLALARIVTTEGDRSLGQGVSNAAFHQGQGSSPN